MNASAVMCRVPTRSQRKCGPVLSPGAVRQRAAEFHCCSTVRRRLFASPGRRRNEQSAHVEQHILIARISRLSWQTLADVCSCILCWMGVANWSGVNDVFMILRASIWEGRKKRMAKVSRFQLPRCRGGVLACLWGACRCRS